MLLERFINHKEKMYNSSSHRFEYNHMGTLIDLTVFTDFYSPFLFNTLEAYAISNIKYFVYYEQMYSVRIL